MGVTTSTCIVGLKHEGVVYIGGDSLGSNGYSGTAYTTKKVFHIQDRQEIIAGYTTSFRMGQLLQYSNNLFNDDDFLINDRINEKYLVNTFIPNLQELFNKGGFEKIDSNVRQGGVFLFGIKDKLYTIQSDYSILESDDDYIACGCGQDFALGSLATSRKDIYSPGERILLALQSSSKFSTGVSAPFYMVNTNSTETIKL